jgi:hypothetical protein
MLLTEIIAVHSESLKKHKNTLREENTDFFNVIPSVTYRNDRTLKG